MNTNKEPREKERRRVCPYCEEEILIAEFPVCQPCGVSLHYCTKCQIVVEREAETCPQCGGELEWK